MALRNGVTIRSELDPKFVFENVLVTSGAATTIVSGSPTKAVDATAAACTGAVAPMVDGNGTTSERFFGISKSDSTDTAAADGAVDIWMPLPGLVYECRTKTTTDANTAAKVQALFGKRTVFELTGAGYQWMIDGGATDAAASMLVVIGGNYNNYHLFFTYKSTGTVLGQIA